MGAARQVETGSWFSNPGAAARPAGAAGGGVGKYMVARAPAAAPALTAPPAPAPGTVAVAARAPGTVAVAARASGAVAAAAGAVARPSGGTAKVRRAAGRARRRCAHARRLGERSRPGRRLLTGGSVEERRARRAFCAWRRWAWRLCTRAVVTVPPPSHTHTQVLTHAHTCSAVLHAAARTLVLTNRSQTTLEWPQAPAAHGAPRQKSHRRCAVPAVPASRACLVSSISCTRACAPP